MNNSNRNGKSGGRDAWICFEVILSVKYAKPAQLEIDRQMSFAAGYTMKFLVVADSEGEVRDILRAEIKEGEIDWHESEIKQMTAADFAEYSLSKNNVFGKRGVILRSSQFLYPDS